ncbi:hypothetical protein O181_049428 [Austropuccinia psidii MF-1]|uniref:Reverse transcriptase Ty1/copia-type domain-containing protein n=1 Tax=Austropuccinia psidii MF-1 TaxID=1389203 RepID=A0A9Q3DZV3_9BASI|nr:hypothetical protein [Austropuccinia psidii MF-1]
MEVLKEFQIKDVSPAELMLGIKVTHFSDYVSLDQQHFTESLLELYGMCNCNSVLTPLIPNEHLSPASPDEILEFGKLKVNFRSAVGSINYLSTATRPDLSFVVSALLQHLEKPGILHWKSFLHVLKYLKGTQDVGLTYPKNINVGVVTYTNADWGNCCVSRRLVTGFLATVGGSLVLWKTKKLPSVSLSTTEAEYKALCDLTSELMWLRQWCGECDILQLNNPIPVHEDNQSCINVVRGDCNLNNKRMKHINIQLHFIKEAVRNNIIKLIYTPTADMLADFLTKSVSRPILARALNSLGVLSLVLSSYIISIFIASCYLPSSLNSLTLVTKMIGTATTVIRRTGVWIRNRKCLEFATGRVAAELLSRLFNEKAKYETQKLPFKRKAQNFRALFRKNSNGIVRKLSQESSILSVAINPLGIRL